MREITDATFETEVLKSELPVLVDFWATWCRPCKMIAPVVQALSEKYDGKIKFVKLDVDANPQNPQTYRINSIPTLMIFKNGQPVDTSVGFKPESVIEKIIQKNL